MKSFRLLFFLLALFTSLLFFTVLIAFKIQSHPTHIDAAQIRERRATVQ